MKKCVWQKKVNYNFCSLFQWNDEDRNQFLKMDSTSIEFFLDIWIVSEQTKLGQKVDTAIHRWYSFFIWEPKLLKDFKSLQLMRSGIPTQNIENECFT